jgi:hypothetical protein
VLTKRATRGLDVVDDAEALTIDARAGRGMKEVQQCDASQAKVWARGMMTRTDSAYEEEDSGLY